MISFNSNACDSESLDLFQILASAKFIKVGTILLCFHHRHIEMERYCATAHPSRNEKRGRYPIGEFSFFWQERIYASLPLFPEAWLSRSPHYVHLYMSSCHFNVLSQKNLIISIVFLRRHICILLTCRNEKVRSATSLQRNLLASVKCHQTVQEPIAICVSRVFRLLVEVCASCFYNLQCNILEWVNLQKKMSKSRIAKT